MTFENFKSRVYKIIKKSGAEIKVRFSEDRGNGRFIADLADDVRIIGHSDSFKVTVRWGANHTAIASI